MYCANCDMMVETEANRVRENDEALRYKRWFDTTKGNYDIEDVGDKSPDLSTA